MPMSFYPGGASHYRFSSLEARGVRHAVFGRAGGVSAAPWDSLNVGHKVGDDPQAVVENHCIIYRTLGLAAEDVVTCQQVHGDRVALVQASDGGKTFSATDGLICDVSGLALMMRFADCVPVLFSVPNRSAVGLAHAGWRGTVAKVAAKTARTMIDHYHSRPEELLVAIGPSIGPCCYEVGDEVAERVRAVFAQAPVLARRNGRWFFDLWEANAWQLRQLGVRHIEVAKLCTACHSDEFYSHRASGGSTGRFAVLIG